MKLGLVTYNLAADWDLGTIISRCIAHRFEAVELRTGHKHGVEASLSPSQRREVRYRFADCPVALAGLGTAFEFHSLNTDEVKHNIEGTKEYVKLAADIGAPGVKVRPNGLQTNAGVPKEKSLEQIGLALRECAAFAHDHGIQVRMEVHGQETQAPENMRRIMEIADHPNAFVCWNSNSGEVKNGSVRESFDRLSKWIGLVHMGELCSDAYPSGELLRSLKASGYTGYCLAEIQGSPEPERIMGYYRALWQAYLQAV